MLWVVCSVVPEFQGTSSVSRFNFTDFAIFAHGSDRFHEANWFQMRSFSWSFMDPSNFRITIHKVGAKCYRNVAPFGRCKEALGFFFAILMKLQNPDTGHTWEVDLV